MDKIRSSRCGRRFHSSVSQYPYIRGGRDCQFSELGGALKGRVGTGYNTGECGLGLLTLDTEDLFELEVGF